MVAGGLIVGLTGVGRVVGEAHWCSDVVAGAMCGICLASITANVVRVLFNNHEERRRSSDEDEDEDEDEG